MRAWTSIAEQHRKHASRLGRVVDTVVMHWTHGYGDSEAVGRYVLNTKREISCTLAIGRPGDVLQVAPLDRTAWHAGDAVGPLWDGGRGGREANRRSVGIELCNWGPVVSEEEAGKVEEGGGVVVEAKLIKRGFARWKRWEGYTEDQLASAREAIARMRDLLPDLKYITGHLDLTPGKADPGPLFPWVLMQCGLIRCERQWLKGMRPGQWLFH